MTDETRCEPPPEWQLMAYECVPPEVVADDLLGVLTDLAHNPTADKTIINTLRRARANVQTFTPPAVVAALVEALEAADQFIRNGIELGFIRMPDAGTPDPALKTPAKIEAALALCIAALRARAGGEG